MKAWIIVSWYILFAKGRVPTHSPICGTGSANEVQLCIMHQWDNTTCVTLLVRRAHVPSLHTRFFRFERLHGVHIRVVQPTLSRWEISAISSSFLHKHKDKVCTNWSHRLTRHPHRRTLDCAASQDARDWVCCIESTPYTSFACSLSRNSHQI